MDEAWDCMDGRKLNKMKQGRPFAFLIDLLDADGEVAFRIHYVDAPSEAPLGLPPAEIVADHPVDLAMLCMPTWWLAPGYPGSFVEGTRARHVLVTHYEDFFRSQEKPTRFVARLTNKRANGFMEELSLAMGDGDERRIAPSSEMCGPSGEAWTMPLPGEWMVFPVSDESRSSVDR